MAVAQTLAAGLAPGSTVTLLLGDGDGAAEERGRWRPGGLGDTGGHHRTASALAP